MTNQARINAFLTHITPGRAVSSIERYEISLRKTFTEFFGETDPATITHRELSKFVLWMLEQKFTPQGARYALMVTKWYFRWMVDNGMLPEEALDHFIARKLPKLVKIKSKRRMIQRDEHERILRAVRGGAARSSKTWWYHACILAWHTGLRLVDIAHLKWETINFNEEKIELSPRKTIWRSVEVSIPLEEDLAVMLFKLRAEPFYVSEYVLPDMAGWYQSSGSSGLDTQFQVICAKANVEGVSFHCYRHAFVSRLLNAGVEPLIIGSMTGQNPRTIETYAHISDAARRDALAKARQAMHDASLVERGINPRPKYLPHEETEAQDQKHLP